MGRVELGVYDGLVALRQAGHPWTPDGGLRMVELRDRGACGGYHQQVRARHPLHHPQHQYSPVLCEFLLSSTNKMATTMLLAYWKVFMLKN